MLHIHFRDFYFDLEGKQRMVIFAWISIIPQLLWKTSWLAGACVMLIVGLCEKVDMAVEYKATWPEILLTIGIYSFGLLIFTALFKIYLYYFKDTKKSQSFRDPKSLVEKKGVKEKAEEERQSGQLEEEQQLKVAEDKQKTKRRKRRTEEQLPKRLQKKAELRRQKERQLATLRQLEKKRLETAKEAEEKRKTKRRKRRAEERVLAEEKQRAREQKRRAEEQQLLEEWRLEEEAELRRQKEEQQKKKASRKKFEYIGENTYSCGGQTHRVKEYRHRETGLDFAAIPGGSFTMGGEAFDNEKPKHRIKLDGFLIAKTVTTQRVWQQVMGTTPWKDERYVKEGDDYPAVCVSWKDAQKFCEKICMELPTEAQWEYACRAGTSSSYYWGATMNGTYAWYYKNAWNRNERYAHKVGQKKPNAYGLYDMAGNVQEWCRDWYDREYYKNSPQNNPYNYRKDEYRVNRGGSFCLKSFYCRSANRSPDPPYCANYLLGFRLAI